MYSSTSFCFIQWCSRVTGNFHPREVLWNVDASISCIRSQRSVALLMDNTPWLRYERRRNMCRLECNVCGVTTVNGSSVGSSSWCRLSTRCSLSVISPDRPSTAGVLAFLWTLHVFCLDYHQPIWVSVCVGRKRQFTTSHHIFFLPTSTPVFLLLHGITPTSSMGVRSAATCLG